jgi:hypothetical protein
MSGASCSCVLCTYVRYCPSLFPYSILDVSEPQVVICRLGTCYSDIQVIPYTSTLFKVRQTFPIAISIIYSNLIFSLTLEITSIISLIMSNDGAENERCPTYTPYQEVATCNVLVNESVNIRGK